MCTSNLNGYQKQKGKLQELTLSRNACTFARYDLWAGHSSSLLMSLLSYFLLPSSFLSLLSLPPSFLPPSLSSTGAQSKVCAVVGGCGFLGRHLTEGVLERGYQVNVFDLKTTFENDQVRFFTGDLCRKEVMVEDLSYTSER